jgi:hypothetical protein
MKNKALREKSGKMDSRCPIYSKYERFSNKNLAVWREKLKKRGVWLIWVDNLRFEVGL